MQVIAPALAVMFSVLFPGKMWFTPDQPLEIQVKGAGGEVTLVLMDFLGKPMEPEGSADIAGDQTVNLMSVWPQLKTPGTYVLSAVPKGKPSSEFVGTPLVIGVRGDKRRDAPPGPMVIKIEPLRYGVLSTEKGDMTIVFYYDVAPNTAANFISLANGGFFDGLTFHRIVPSFVLQGGDPKGDGTGGPGYHIEAEFNAREHREGVLSMARQGDPIEAQGAMPRSEAANSAGSQFFICLDYEHTKQLDGRYTAFGKVVEGMDVAREIAKTPTDPQNDRPTTPQVIKSIRILPVAAAKNPYAPMLHLSPSPTTMP